MHHQVIPIVENNPVATQQLQFAVFPHPGNAVHDGVDNNGLRGLSLESQNDRLG